MTIRETRPSEEGQNEYKEYKNKPVLSVFLTRHAEAWPSVQQKERHLTPEGEFYADQTGDEVSETLGDPKAWLVNKMAASNTRAEETADRMTNRLLVAGFEQFSKTIAKTGSRQKAIDGKIFTVKLPEDYDNQQRTLMKYYQDRLREQGRTGDISDIELFIEWLNDENLPQGIPSAEEVRSLFLKAVKNEQDNLPRLIEELQKSGTGKSLATVIGLNNPRMDLFLETLTGISMKEFLKRLGDEITPRSQGVRIDFYPNRPPEFSVFGSRFTTVAEKDAEEKLTAKRQTVEPITSTLKQFSDPQVINFDKRSQSVLEEELSIEDTVELEKLRKGAENVIKCFQLRRSSDNKKGENLLIVSEVVKKMVEGIISYEPIDPLMLRALKEAGEKIAGKDCQVIGVPQTEHAAQDLGEEVGKRMKTADAILIVTSLSRSHSQQTRDIMYPNHDAQVIESLMQSKSLSGAFASLQGYSTGEIAEKMSKRKLNPESQYSGKGRIISITNTNRDTLTKGAALENPVEMAERIDKFAEVMKGVERVKVESVNGTELEIDLKVPSYYKEKGLVDKPGKLSNFPSGEYCGAVDMENTNGVIIIDGAIGGGIGRVDEPVKITIKNGVAIKIEGDKAAEELKRQLDTANTAYRALHPEDTKTDAYRIAEFAFGMNSQAFRYDGSHKISPPTSLESEKGLGTIHIALGKNDLFKVEESDPDFNSLPIHIDCVAVGTTVIGTKDSGEEVLLIKNGEMVCL
ncbi:MAG: aminopeptidase [Candidatus Magasanikbacteria bacterium]